ncbi:MAG: hypothetical protein RL846_31910 [Deltaproteobacteria bacterium]
MRSRLSYAWVFALLVACGDAGTRLWVRPPATVSGAVIYVVFEAGRPARVFAAGTIEEVFQLELKASSDVSVYALAYDTSLEAMGLDGGHIALRDDGAALPAPAAVYTVEVPAGAPGDWITTSYDERLSALRLDARPNDGCARFGAPVLHTIEGGRNAAFAGRLDGTRALVATRMGGLAVVDEAEVVPVDEPLGVRIVGGLVQPDGRVVVGDPRGRFWAGRLDGTGIELADYGRIFEGGKPWWMAQRGEGPLYVVTSSGAFARREDAGTTVLREPEPTSWWRRGITLDADGNGAAVGVYGAQILEFEDDAEALTERIRPDLQTDLISVLHLSDRLVAGGFDGALYFDDGARLVRRESPIALPVAALSRYQGGLLLGAGGGLVVQYLVERDTFCPTLNVPILIVKHIVVLDAVVVLVGDPPNGASDNVVVVLPYESD